MTVDVVGALTPEYEAILTPQALDFIAALHREFNPRRVALLHQRAARTADLNAGHLPDFLPETAEVRSGGWQVAATPPDLQKRWAEITGPADRKMMINALNSGADVFMVDFEDSLAPHWDIVLNGQINLRDAVRREISFENPDGRRYSLNDQTAVMLVRPRGWHLPEKHVLVDGSPISASLFDFGLYFFHNARALISSGSGPYFYLPKLESHLEARLWNDVFNFAQSTLGIPRGTIRATVLIETILAAFEIEEILYELRDHSAGCNAGRWDYIFSMIKKFAQREDFILPDRAQITMTVPFMRAYTELLVRTCHKRGAHAIGGMAAFIPSRRDAEVNEVAMGKVREDKQREAQDGFDGTWLAHPDLVPIAREVFENALGDKPNQKDRLREEVSVSAAELVNTTIDGAAITEAGVRSNISIGLQYLNAWLGGNGAAAIYNLMEDVATAEISRAQLWQWRYHQATLTDGRVVDAALYSQLCAEELAKLGGKETEQYGAAVEILDKLVLADEFIEFLTFMAYDYLD